MKVSNNLPHDTKLVDTCLNSNVSMLKWFSLQQSNMTVDICVHCETLCSIHVSVQLPSLETILEYSESARATDASEIVIRWSENWELKIYILYLRHSLLLLTMCISVGCDTNPEQTYADKELINHNPPEALRCSSRKFHWKEFYDTSVNNSWQTIIRYVKQHFKIAGRVLLWTRGQRLHLHQHINRWRVLEIIFGMTILVFCVSIVWTVSFIIQNQILVKRVPLAQSHWHNHNCDEDHK